MYNSIICRYHEIAIKGNNRRVFEQQLIRNMREALNTIENLKIRAVRGRIWLELPERKPFSATEIDLIKEKLKFMFGLESFSPAILTPVEINAIKEAFNSVADSVFSPVMARKSKVSFRIRARRSNKRFPLCSKEVEIELATVIGDKYDNDRIFVHLDDDADITVGCEIRDEFAIIFFDSFHSGGGLPTGSNAPVLALLSGGIDSPVAALMTMKRGSAVGFMSFHSDPYTPPETTAKVRRIGEYLNGFQPPQKHFFVNLSPIQKMIRDCCDPQYRTILYRRMMFRIAESVAKKYGFYALLTGESLGQVASQTVENMSVINNSTSMLVLRPLVGMDKLETIRMAEKYGTFELSKEQVPDSCTVFLPSSPATRSDVPRLESEEAKLGDFRKVLDEMIANIEVY